MAKEDFEKAKEAAEKAAEIIAKSIEGSSAYPSHDDEQGWVITGEKTDGIKKIHITHNDENYDFPVIEV